MADDDVQATARVQVTLDIESGSVWGSGTDLAQVHKQATEGALARLRSALDPTTPVHRRPAPNVFSVVGAPRVIMVTTTRKDDAR